MGVIPGTLTLGTAVALSLMRVQVGHVVIFEPAGDNLVTTTGSGSGSGACSGSTAVSQSS